MNPLRRRSGAVRLALGLCIAIAHGVAHAQKPSSELRAGVEPPRLLSEPIVAYPAEASGDGVVVLELVVDAEGAVTSASVVSGGEPFASAAVAAARTWHFAPATRAGKLIAARIRMRVLVKAPESERAATTPGRAIAPAGPLAGEAAGEKKSRGPMTPAKADETIEVVVQGERTMSPTTLTRAEVRQLPGAFGDPFRAVEALPGVTPVGSGLPYFYVRGAPPGNLGYYLDGIRVPALFHAAVGPSVIHPALIDRVELYPGPYPARYGRFAGGIVAAETTAPGSDFGGEAGVRLVDAGTLIEGPFAGDRGHATIAGRYSYTAAILSLIVPELELAYWDYQARVAYRVADDDTVGLFGFGSYDFVAEDEDEDGTPVTLYDVGFHRVDLRYDHALSGEGRLRVAATAGRDASTISEEQIHVENDLIGGRLELTTPLGRRVKLVAGSDVLVESYDLTTRLIGTGTVSVETVDEFNRRYPSRTDVTSGAWVETPLEAARGVRVTPGLRMDVFNSGDTTTASVDPRLAAEFDVTSSVTLVHGLGVAHQRPSFLIPLPGIQPELDRLQRSVQSSYGVRWRLPGDVLASATAYHAITFQLSDALGISRLENGDPGLTEESRMRGRSYGVELMLQRSLTRRLGGYVAYTLSRSERSAGRARGPAAADRTHVANAAASYDLGRRWRIGGRASFYTGVPADVAYVEAAEDPPRSEPYWRLDWRLEKSWPIGSQGAFWAVVVEVLNTTLNEEEINRSCSAYTCRKDQFGPVTVPSVGVEAAF